MIHVPDTNVLLRFANRTDSQHAVVLSAIRKLKNLGDEIHILPLALNFGTSARARPRATVSGFPFNKPTIRCA